MTVYGERLGDDAMGVQGSRARLAGMLAGGVWFRDIRAPIEALNQLVRLWTLSCPSPPLVPARLARATLPHRSLTF